MDPVIYDYGWGITCIDTMYVQPGRAACYLIVQDNRAAFIDTGTAHTVPYLLEVLKSKRIPPEAVEFVIPTHVHLDHAGGAGVLMEKLPNATLVIHPNGARHLIDPTKLVMGATEVYGAENFMRHFGEIRAVNKQRVFAAEDQTTIKLASRTLTFIDTPGHARHHFCVYDETSKGFFTGDTFGLSYKELDNKSGAFIMPTTTPVQFDPDAWQSSLDRLLEFCPQNMYLTHFGRVTEISRLAKELRQDINRYAEIAKLHAREDCRGSKILASLTEYLHQRLKDCDFTQDIDVTTEFLRDDLNLNTAGLEVWLDRLDKQSRQKVNE